MVRPCTSASRNCARRKAWPLARQKVSQHLTCDLLRWLPSPNLRGIDLRERLARAEHKRRSPFVCPEPPARGIRGGPSTQGQRSWPDREQAHQVREQGICVTIAFAA